MYHEHLEYSKDDLGKISLTRFNDIYNKNSPLLETANLSEGATQIAESLSSIKVQLFSRGFILGASWVLSMPLELGPDKLVHGFDEAQKANMPDISSLKFPSLEKEFEEGIVDMCEASYRLGFSDGGMYMMEELKSFYGEMYGWEF